MRIHWLPLLICWCRSCCIRNHKCTSEARFHNQLVLICWPMELHFPEWFANIHLITSCSCRIYIIASSLRMELTIIFWVWLKVWGTKSTATRSDENKLCVCVCVCFWFCIVSLNVMTWLPPQSDWYWRSGIEHSQFCYWLRFAAVSARLYMFLPWL